MDGVSLSYFLVPVIAFLGFLLRRLFVKMESSMNEREIRQLIDDKMQGINIRQANYEHDLARIEKKMERELVLIHRKLDNIWNYVANGKK